MLSVLTNRSANHGQGADAQIFGVAAKPQELKCSRRAPGYFTLIGDKTPPAARDSSAVVRA